MGVVGADGLRDLPVGADGVLQQAGCLELGEHLNTIGDHGHDLGDHTVVGAAGHIGVEFLVGRAVVLPGADLVLHLLTQLAQSVLFGFLNALGGQLSHPRLQLQAQLHQVHRQRDLILYIGKAQRVLDLTRLFHHKGALAPADLQTVACHQQLDRFANGAAPHVQAGSQLKLVGQLLACIDVLVNDDLIDLIRHLLCKGGSAVVLNVAEYAMILCHRICTPFCSACLQLL